MVQYETRLVSLRNPWLTPRKMQRMNDVLFNLIVWEVDSCNEEDRVAIRSEDARRNPFVRAPLRVINRPRGFVREPIK